jgi:hypothetical protein
MGRNVRERERERDREWEKIKGVKESGRRG